VRFVDTNVLLYAVGRSAGERAKTEAALGILESADLVLSVQVLQEFYVQATRPTRADRLSHEQAVLLIESMALRFPIQEVTVPLLRSALDLAARFRVSYWDAAIVEAARAGGCSVILTEDMSDGQDFAGVTVKNPFTSRRTRRRRG